ncbi:hypothetical protein B0H10DRAFT_3200 [Mycena sp. CBHHK59/15]|nr:hypothetical protein B0H10DRAFT_3200 [Mycena sp. CBHHK59/15]
MKSSSSILLASSISVVVSVCSSLSRGSSMCFRGSSRIPISPGWCPVPVRMAITLLAPPRSSLHSSPCALCFLPMNKAESIVNGSRTRYTDSSTIWRRCGICIRWIHHHPPCRWDHSTEYVANPQSPQGRCPSPPPLHQREPRQPSCHRPYCTDVHRVHQSADHRALDTQRSCSGMVSLPERQPTSSSAAL